MREKLIEILAECNCNAEYCKDCEFGSDIDGCVRRQKEIIADHLIENGVVIPVRCKKCKHWQHMGDGTGDCTNARFHLPGHADPTMEMDGFCSCGERKDND